MINILEITNTCSSPILGYFLTIAKSMVTLIQLLAPIVLIISLVIRFTSLSINPDDQEGIKKIKNSILACIILFFLAFIINITMGLLDKSFTISKCWNSIQYKQSSNFQYNDDDEEKSKVLFSLDDYEKGEEEEPGPPAVPISNSSDGSSTDDGSDSTGTPAVSGNLEIHFINSGSKVDAIYIKAGDKSMFIDGGFKYNASVEINYLNKIGVTHIDYYLGTHSHKDHVEAAPKIIKKYGIKNVIVARNTCDDSGNSPCTWYTIKLFAREQGISLDGVSYSIMNPGKTMTFGDTMITCLGPNKIYESLARGDGYQNYNSIIFRLDHGSNSFLFTGDNTSHSEFKTINSKYSGKLQVDVLKNGHHHSDMGDTVYSMIKAKYVIFPTSNGNLPTSSIINSIKKNGAESYYIVATSKQKNVLVTSSGSQIGITPKYTP